MVFSGRAGDVENVVFNFFGEYYTLVCRHRRVPTERQLVNTGRKMTVLRCRGHVEPYPPRRCCRHAIAKAIIGDEGIIPDTCRVDLLVGIGYMAAGNGVGDGG